MSSVQDRALSAATLLSESAWLSALFGILGAAAGAGGSPLSLLAVFAILSASFMTTRVLGLIIMPPAVAHVLQMLSGVVVLYLTLATQVATGGQGLDLGWAGSLISGVDTADQVVGSFIAIMLWWRGGRLASTGTPVEALGASFRIGIGALALAALVDVFNSADLHVFPLMFLFFAAGLAGLSVGHILPQSRRVAQDRVWPRVIGAVVAVVLVSGLLFSLLQKNAISALSDPVASLGSKATGAVFNVVVVPIGYVVELVVMVLTAIISLLSPRDVDFRIEDPTAGFVEQMKAAEDGTEGGTLANLLQAVEWVILVVVALAILYFLARTYRRRVRLWRVDAEGTREAVSADVDPAHDMAELLWNLVPSRFRRPVRRKAFALPSDEAEVVDVFRVYFGLLALAEDKGFPRPENETPSEYQRTLEKIFPSTLVRAATDAFIRACYGHQPAPRGQIDEMRATLERLA